jgi:hypothetical protein
MRTEGPAGNGAAQEAMRGRGEEDLVGAGLPLNPGGEVGGFPHGRHVVPVGAVAHRAQHGDARVQPDANLKRNLPQRREH